MTKQTVNAGAAHSATAAGSDGYPLVAVLDTGSDDLRVVHCADATCSSSTGTTRLGVISYYDGTGGRQDLKVAHCGNLDCTTSSFVAVDTAGQVGWNTSITIGSDGLPFVSYRDVSGNRVVGLHCPNVFCVPYLRRR